MSAEGYAWAPQPGPQTDLIENTWCSQIFFGGAVGGGKSDGLLGDFLQDVDRYGPDWQGILFRRTNNELEKLVKRSSEIFPQTGAVWTEKNRWWLWPNGACLKLRYLERNADVQRYVGHDYTWIGWDELPQWPSADAYKFMMSRLRVGGGRPVPTMRVRASGNPGGAGHGWIKAHFIDHAPNGFGVREDTESGDTVMFIPSRVQDNKILIENDPNYVKRLRGIGSPELVRALLEGDWNAIAGAYFPEFGERHVIKPFEVPSWWTRVCSMDWGSAKPFSVGWWAISDGTPIHRPNGKTDIYLPGCAICYREWYGAKGPNEGLRMRVEDVAAGILYREKGEKIVHRVGDKSIGKTEGGPSIKEVFMRNGVAFNDSDSNRVSGWEQLRSRLVGEELGLLDKYGQEVRTPMIHWFDNCIDSIRTIPTLQHSDRDAEDAEKRGYEDHAADQCRYFCMSRPWYNGKAKEVKPRYMKNVTYDDLLNDYDKKLELGTARRVRRV